jgi:hypothetical protein
MKTVVKYTVAFAVFCAASPETVVTSYAGAPAPLAGAATPSSALATTSSSTSNTWSVGADGWTVFRGSSGTGSCGSSSSNYTGTCVVYVANAGNDGTCVAQPLPVTSTPAHPCATPAKAQTLLRNGSPDWMLLKKGDTWQGGMNGPSSGAWNRTGGRSTAEPMLISSYGTGARPLFTAHGIDTSCYSTTALRGQYMAIVGIECYNDSADPASPTYSGVTASADMNSASPTLTGLTSTSGIAPGYVAYGSGINGLTVSSVTGSSVTLNGNPGFTATRRSIQFNKPFTQSAFALIGVANFLVIEDCKLRFGGLTIQNSAAAPVSGLNLRIRRNLILDAYGYIGHGGTGVFLSDNQQPGGSILFEQNLVDHAGYNTSIWGAGGTVFSHNFYLHDNNPPISFVGNITANASATGAQVRNGGNIYNNLSLGNPIAFVSNPGIQPNATTYSYNVITEGSDIIVGVRNADGNTPAGSKILNLDGVLTTGNYAFVGKNIADLDNPGAVTGSVVSVTAATAAMSVNVSAGQRGDGVKVGDRLAIYSPRAQGIVVGPTGTFSPDVNAGGGTYPIGSSVFYFPKGYELPSWVVPGMSIALYGVSAFPGGQTTIAAISGDRTQLRTAAASLSSILGGSSATGAEQNVFVIWTPGDQSHFPPQTIGPNNIYTTSASLYAPSAAYLPQSFTRAINASQNYYYNWNGIAANNVADFGVSGSNINVPNKLNVAATNSYPNATIESYDKSIGGPGTAAHFLAQARLQSKDSWDIRYTANAANNYIRNAFGCSCTQ